MKNRYLIFGFIASLIIIVSGFTSYYYPSFRPFGNSTTFTDSTNYININDGLNLPNDSLRVGKDIFVGVKGGALYLDSNRRASLQFVGSTLKLSNNKSTGGMSFDNGLTSTDAGFSFIMSEGTPAFTIYKYRNGQLRTLVTYDSTNGMKVNTGGMGVYDNDKGFMQFPTLTGTERDALTAVTGMTIFNTSTGNLQTYDGSTWRDLF